jgi:hypothetical protein
VSDADAEENKGHAQYFASVLLLRPATIPLPVLQVTTNKVSIKKFSFFLSSYIFVFSLHIHIQFSIFPSLFMAEVTT